VVRSNGLTKWTRSRFGPLRASSLGKHFAAKPERQAFLRGVRHAKLWPMPRLRSDAYDRIPDVRDGLTRVERVVLYVLHEAKREYGERYVPTALLYGRVVEHVDIGIAEFERLLQRLAGR
jgi:hypothetical protein